MTTLRNKTQHLHTSLGSICILALAASSAAFAQTPSVYATGLSRPSKIILIPNGSLLSTEVGMDANSGRVSVIAPGGTVRALINGLPSGLSAPNGDPDGPNGLAVTGNILYVANGEGDGFASGTAPGTLTPNPKGPSSPLFASVLKFTFSSGIDTLSAGFTLKATDHMTLLDGKTVSLSNGAGGTATVELLSQFRPGIADPNVVYRNSHPYGLLLSPAGDLLYVNDAGMNSVVQINTTTGRATTITRFSQIPNATPPPPGSDAVPTSITFYNDQLLVSLLSGAPFVPGASRVMIVDPATGSTAPFIGALSSAIDVKYRLNSDDSRQFFVLQFSQSLTTGAPGRLTSHSTKTGTTVLAEGLVTPTSMALDASAGRLYITSLAQGTVSVLDVGK